MVKFQKSVLEFCGEKGSARIQTDGKKESNRGRERIWNHTFCCRGERASVAQCYCEVEEESQSLFLFCFLFWVTSWNEVSWFIGLLRRVLILPGLVRNLLWAYELNLHGLGLSFWGLVISEVCYELVIRP